MAKLSLTFLGSPLITLDNQAVHIGRRKAIALLAYLAVTGRRCSRTTLGELLWPDYDERNARSEVRRALSALNKVLGGEWLAADRQDIELVASGEVWVDVVAFRERVAVCRIDGAAEPLALLAEAAAFAQDDFLAGFGLPDAPQFEQWQLLENQVLRRDLAWVLETLSELLLAAGDSTAALPYAQRWLALDPLHEAAQQRVMAILAAQGDTAAAVRQYEQCVKLLQEELQTAPAEETIALYEQIRQGEFVLGQTTGASPTPALAAAQLSLPKHNLPQSLTVFIGRQMEQRNLAQLLTDGGQRLITLTGPGGIGKTRLALQLAREMIAQGRVAWPQGVWLVNLATITAGEQLAPAIAEALPLVLRGNAPPAEQLLEYVRGRKLLLVLDNFEQLVDETAAVELLDQLLQSAPQVTLLITSRERLNLQGELVYHLLGMPFPAAADDDLEMYDAVQLFVQSAQRSRRSFTLTAENRAAVVRICQLLQGMPLALDMAAAWVRMLNCPAIAAEIETGLDFLEATARNLPARHRSMRAVFDHSWRLLSEEEQRIFGRLSVFRGGFTREGAVAVAGAALRPLLALLDKSFLQRDEHGRFERHPLLWQFGVEKLRSDPAAEADAQHAHATFYADFLAARMSHLRGPQQAAIWRELETEWENMRSAWRYAFEREDGVLLDKMQRPFFHFFNDRGRFADGIEFFGDVVANLPAAFPQALVMRLQTYYGAFQTRVGRYEEAEQSLLDIAPAAAALGLTDCATLAWLTLGVLQDMRGNYAEAKTYLARARQLAEATQDQMELAKIMNSTAIIAWREGDYEAAERYLRHALALSEAYGAPYDIALRLGNLGILALTRGENQEAIRLLEDAYARFAQIDNLWGMGVTLQTLCTAYAAVGDRQQVLERHRQALQYKEEVGDNRGVVDSYMAIGMTYVAMGLLDEAQQALWAALKRARAAVNVAGMLVPVVGEIGMWLAAAGEVQRGMVLMKFACSQSALQGDIRDELTAALAEWTGKLSAEEEVAVQEEAAGLVLDEVVGELLRERRR